MEHGKKPLKGEICSVAFSLHSNAPGALLEALTQVASLGLNMSRIESRPSKRELGEYVFFVDLDLSSFKSKSYNQLLIELEPLCEHLVHFGSYKSNTFEEG